MRLTAHLRTLTFAILLVPFEGLAAQTLVPPVVVGHPKFLLVRRNCCKRAGQGRDLLGILNWDCSPAAMEIFINATNKASHPSIAQTQAPMVAL